jgi:hypothetical protein
MRQDARCAIRTQHKHNTSSRGALCGQFDGEFDPGSGQTLAACLRHASRTGGATPQWRTGEERVTDLPRGGGYPAEMPVKTACDPRVRAGGGKPLGAAGGGRAGLAGWRGKGPPRRRSVAGLRGRPATLGLRHGPDSYGRQQLGNFGNGRKPDRVTPRAGGSPSGCKPLFPGTSEDGTWGRSLG